MIYVEEQVTDGIRFHTHPKARRGRGILFATAPFVLYLLALCVLFVMAVEDLSLWNELKRVAAYGVFVAALGGVLAFLLGYRVADEVASNGARLTLRHTPALGGTRVLDLAFTELRALAIDPSLRSLGADVLLVAVRSDGQRVPIAEGDPHSAQIRELAARMAQLGGVPLEKPQFTA